MNTSNKVKITTTACGTIRQDFWDKVKVGVPVYVAAEPEDVRWARMTAEQRSSDTHPIVSLRHPADDADPSVELSLEEFSFDHPGHGVRQCASVFLSLAEARRLLDGLSLIVRRMETHE